MVGRLLVLLFSLAISSALAAEEKQDIRAPGHRVALVVGNGSYDDSGAVLNNPANDAKSIAEKFRGFGIEVIEAIDLDYRGMREALRRFDRALQTADAGVFYYAGHAMEYRGRNYLFPTDAILETEGDVSLGLIEMDQVLQVMETAVPTRLVFLDACRNNPLARGFRSSLGASRAAAVGRGLADIDSAVGTFIAYATAPGDVAADGRNKNSPFTKAMLTHLDEPGLEISQLMQRVRNNVIEATNQKQVPWDSSSLRGPFILNLDVTINAAPTALPAVADDGSQRAETVFWESIEDSGRIANFEAYIERFGDDGIFAPLARTQIADLQRRDLETSEATLGFDRREVQQALSAFGYDIGEVDGIFGRRTRTAIETWQNDQGQQVTGYVSAKQARAILAAVASGSQIAGAKDSLSANTPSALSSSRLDESAAKAVALFEKSCRRGNGEDCTRLGESYEKARGVEQDYLMSAQYYRKGCDSGDAQGCTNLGFLHRRGLGLDRDEKMAAALYRQGCDGGHARGCSNLGYLYRKGFGVDLDYDKSAVLYSKACDEGFAEGCSNLGYLREIGRGVEQDYSLAAKLYKQGCDGAYPNGCTGLGILYNKGLGVDLNKEKAEAFFKEGCDGGHGAGCSELSKLHQE